MGKVYAIGDCVLDVIFENNQPVSSKPGGSFLNSSVSLGRLGVDVSLISELGTDLVGKQIIDFLQNNHVNTEHISRYSDSNSNLALAFLDKEKNADYLFYKTRKGLEDCICFPETIDSNDIVLFGSFLAIKKEFREKLLNFLTYAKAQGAILIYDPNYRAQHLPLLPEVLPYIKENMLLADIIKASNEDFELISQHKSFKQALEWIRKFSNAHLLYTANREGVHVHINKTYFFKVPTIQPISTVGAGDTFNASIAWFLTKNKIGREELGKFMNEDKVRDLVEQATYFAQSVCMSYDNFIAKEIAEPFK
jgi:fructokinase